jgi:hypothetical protein
MDHKFIPLTPMKKWIENRISIMKQSKDPKVIVFPIVRRANQVEEYRENQRKMSELKNNDLIIKLTSRDEAANVYKVTFPHRKIDDFDDFDGDSPKSA